MKDKNLKGYLQQSLGEKVQPKRLEETIKLCTEIVREQEVTRAEPVSYTHLYCTADGKNQNI